MKIFFDSSAFVKRYVNETGSEQVVEICQKADALALSIICLPEIISTLCRLVREGKLSEEEYEQLKTAILTDLEDIEICDITPYVMLRVISCLENNTLRAMDAIHLGSAIVYGADQFVSSDQKQIQAAQATGLTVVKV
ncbi:MAG: VapC toxin family PIN domain ribonuclease [Candidatus Parabeggiatoa sp. nov. 3]|nr:MAG: VapC toxin family PIN domain ribonuclease [Gammaproteobacteria bacterium]RKZ84890.1 MAG: VapC toxin family PIN domain ribonuclease [Gammaproteobacteria bacterium]